MVVFSNEEPASFIECQTVFEYIFNNTHVPPGMPMFISFDDPTNYVTHGQIKALILRFAAGLKLLGLQRGDVVAISATNCWEYAMILHGAMVAGGAVCLFDPSESDVNVISKNLRKVEAKFVIVHPSTLARTSKAAQLAGIPRDAVFTIGKSVGRIRSISETLLNHNEIASVLPLTRREFEQSPALISFTSGSTSEPKAVIISHKMLIVGMASMRHPILSAKNSLVKHVHLAAMAVTGFCHMSGCLFALHANLKNGIRTYYGSRSDIRELGECVQTHRITDLVLGPGLIADLANNPIADQYDFTSLIVVIATGGQTSASVIEAAQKRTRGLVLNVYGLTEGLALVHPVIGYKSDLPGKLCPGVQAKIIDSDGNELGANAVGELLIRGPGITPGYYKDPEATAKAIDSEGYFHTGDLCHFDDDNFLFMVERMKDMGKALGIKYSLREVEKHTLVLPGVIESCAITVVRERDLFEQLIIYVILRQDAEDPAFATKLKNYLLKSMPVLKTAEPEVRVVSVLPRTAGYKVNKRALREAAAREFNAIVAVDKYNANPVLV